jgi:hypothetical protein
MLFRVSTWLRHYATSWKVAGSNPGWGGFFFFNLHNPSSRTMALGSTKPLTGMSTRNLPGSKKRPVRRADNLAECLKMREPQPLATLRASAACTGITLPVFFFTFCINTISCLFLAWIFLMKAKNNKIVCTIHKRITWRRYHETVHSSVNKIWSESVSLFLFFINLRVSVATGYMLDDPGSIPGMEGFCSSPQRLDELWDPPSTGADFPRSKAVGAWSWPVISV